MSPNSEVLLRVAKYVAATRSLSHLLCFCRSTFAFKPPTSCLRTSLRALALWLSRLIQSRRSLEIGGDGSPVTVALRKTFGAVVGSAICARRANYAGL